MTIQCQYHWLLSLRGGRVTPFDESPIELDCLGVNRQPKKQKQPASPWDRPPWWWRAPQIPSIIVIIKADGLPAVVEPDIRGAGYRFIALCITHYRKSSGVNRIRLIQKACRGIPGKVYRACLFVGGAEKYPRGFRKNTERGERFFNHEGQHGS
ncbi:MAG: hypothetical protein BECKG1743D_GA0114223_101702 [Candidatus Kentron sp. G]|nr:MAG: hypothetical protein BECKG1743D_GA0114223_101702 [Candidatus Kentron sp. G]